MISSSPTRSDSDQLIIDQAKEQFEASGTLTTDLQRRIANIVKQTGSNPLFGVCFKGDEFDTELLQSGVYDPVSKSSSISAQGKVLGDVTDRDDLMPTGDTDDLGDK